MQIHSEIMGGNICEWNETEIGPACSSGIRGDSYSGTRPGDYLRRSSSRSGIPPYAEWYFLGFRVASVPVECPLADVTNDCFIDLEDLAKVASKWLTGRPRTIQPAIACLGRTYYTKTMKLPPLVPDVSPGLLKLSFLVPPQTLTAWASGDL